ncbi:hypothetical protein P9112_014572 [Eukaryota sp. TZLM1-RC]
MRIPLRILFLPDPMAKSKNHTAHNQNHKDHRNGIKKPKKLCRSNRGSTKGMDPKFRRNMKFVRQGNFRALQEQKAAMKA